MARLDVLENEVIAMKEEAAMEEGQMPSGASNVTTVSVVSHQPTALSNDIQLERIRVLEIENGNLKEENGGLIEANGGLVERVEILERRN